MAGSKAPAPVRNRINARATNKIHKGKSHHFRLETIRRNRNTKNAFSVRGGDLSIEFTYDTVSNLFVALNRKVNRVDKIVGSADHFASLHKTYCLYCGEFF